MDTKGKKRKNSFGREDGLVRLQKVLAGAGIDSRRNCEQLILEGVVSVNGKIIDTLPVLVNPDTDDIRVHGRRIAKPEKVYYLMNKPKNVLCTNSDPFGRKKVVDFIESAQRIFCAGRLDTDTTGAIILTNDCELANRLTHPRYELSKTYQVTVKGKMESDALEKLKQGIWLAEGKTSKAAVKILHSSNLLTTLEITIRQSLNRQIRRSMARLDYKVKDIKRTHIGKIELKGVPAGGYKKLTSSQVAYLKLATGLAESK